MDNENQQKCQKSQRIQLWAIISIVGPWLPVINERIPPYDLRVPLKHPSDPGMFSCRSFQSCDEQLVYAITVATMRTYAEETFGIWVEEKVRESIAALNPIDCEIIQIENQDVGLIVVERTAEDIRLDSLYLLPEAQNKGIGTTLLRNLQAEARHKKLPLRLRVLQCNPARLWYQREGFVTTRATPERWFMEYNPGTR